MATVPLGGEQGELKRGRPGDGATKRKFHASEAAGAGDLDDGVAMVEGESEASAVSPTEVSAPLHAAVRSSSGIHRSGVASQRPSVWSKQEVHMADASTSTNAAMASARACLDVLRGAAVMMKQNHEALVKVVRGGAEDGVASRGEQELAMLHGLGRHISDVIELCTASSEVKEDGLEAEGAKRDGHTEKQPPPSALLLLEPSGEQQDQESNGGNEHEEATPAAAAAAAAAAATTTAAMQRHIDQLRSRMGVFRKSWTQIRALQGSMTIQDAQYVLWYPDSCEEVKERWISVIMDSHTDKVLGANEEQRKQLGLLVTVITRARDLCLGMYKKPRR